MKGFEGKLEGRGAAGFGLAVAKPEETAVEASRLAQRLSVAPPPGTCDARQKDGYGRLVWIPIGSSGISVAYGNGYVMILSYSLSAPVSLYHNTIIQQLPPWSLLPTPE